VRFPIKLKLVPWVEYANLSGALQESLMDEGIINFMDGRPTQDYFDLPINEGSLLGCMLYFFDATPRFHVGCTLDERPPSFNFSTETGDPHSREGQFSFTYGRAMKLEVFFENRSFRNKSGHRDLVTLSAAYNVPGNYTESFALSWDGWVGEDHPRFGKTGFSYVNMGVIFEKELLTDVGFRYIDRMDYKCGPLYEMKGPFNRICQTTLLRDIWERYKNTKGSDLLHSINVQDLARLRYTVGDALFGLFQAAGNAIQSKADITSNRDVITRATPNFDLATVGRT
jgi:hypothetical protein